MISAFDDGLYVESVGNSGFSGGITNTGAITTSYEYGIYLYDVGVSGFSGNITNSATISAKGYDGYGIYAEYVADAGAFTGNIANSGAISAYDDRHLYL